MALIKPFKAVYYNKSKVGDLSNVVTPPYDVIDAREQARLRKRHPNNFVHLILGKAPQAGLHKDEDYARAGKLLKGWLDDGVFVRDDRSCFYIYEQTFADKNRRRLTRRGLFCTALLQEFGKGDVYPHENTLSGPKRDRLRLMHETRANLGSVFMLFGDKEGKAADLFRKLSAESPDIEFTDEFGVENRAFRVCDEEDILQIRKLFEGKKLFIADGHHRYETAVNYRNQRMKAEGKNCPESVNYVLAMCVPMSDEGLVIWPTHRLVGGVPDFDADKFLEKCSERFRVNPEGNAPSTLEELLSRMAAVQDGIAFGVYTKERGFSLLALKDRNALDEIEGASEILKRLDVTILHKFIIEEILGVSQTDKERIDYTPDEEAVKELVDLKEFQIGFFLNSTPVEKVKEAALRHEKMPPKSTFFYPKLCSGLIFNLLD